MSHLDKRIVLETLTPAQRRVVIAKDVIAALDAARIQAKQGTYCSTDIPVEKVNEKSLREELPAVRECEVCALGALFVAKVARFNDFTVADDKHTRKHSPYRFGRFGIGSKGIKKSLAGYFDTVQLGLIETAFEGASCFAEDAIFESSGELSKKERAQILAAQNFSRSLNAEFRMRKIMRNIVKNKGTFKP